MKILMNTVCFFFCSKNMIEPFGIICTTLFLVLMHTVPSNSKRLFFAFKQQKDYLVNKIVKPFGVRVEAAFQRVETLTSLLFIFILRKAEEKYLPKYNGKHSRKCKKVTVDIKRER